MDRFLRKQGVDTDRLSVLDRLAFLGKHTMGALMTRRDHTRDRRQPVPPGYLEMYRALRAILDNPEAAAAMTGEQLLDAEKALELAHALAERAG